VTLRARLTLWYTLVLSGVIFLFAAVVYFMLSTSLMRQVEDTLERTADDILRASKIQISGIPVSAIQLELDLTANVFVQIFNPQGELIQETMDVPGMGAFDPDGLFVDVPTFSTVMIEDARLRVLTIPVAETSEGRLVGYLQLAEPINTVDHARSLLLIITGGGGIFVIGVAALVGWITAGTALKPIDEVTETALQITRADDLSLRIPLAEEPNDEVGRMVLAFNETLERLENLFQIQRRFLADISHELRTPLTVIRGNVDLLRRMGELDNLSLDTITSEVERMTRMVRDLLLLAQAETGRLPLANEVVELDTLLLDVFQQAKIMAPEGVHVGIGTEDQARVMGDRDRLKQVLLNLVANALDHTPPGGSVIMSLACMGAQARVEVQDTGVGISEEELPHIFERFYRADRSRKRRDGGGAGLGLSIAYWIARSHQGDLKVQSEQGVGTTFTLWLPLLEGPCGNAA